MTKAYLVGQQGTQIELLSTLFHAFFEDGEDINDTVLLAGLATRANVFKSKSTALSWLEGNELEEEVKRFSAETQSKGIRIVPVAIFDGKYKVTGCQKPECYSAVSIFRYPLSRSSSIKLKKEELILLCGFFSASDNQEACDI